MFIFCVPTLNGNDSSNSLRGMEVWSPQSPDLNPSEQVRDILGDKDKKSRIFKSWRKCYRGVEKN